MSVALVVSVALSGCALLEEFLPRPRSDGGMMEGGVMNPDGGGWDAGTTDSEVPMPVPGQRELSDGTLGSSCAGACSSGLRCALGGEVIAGYCTRPCSSATECGPLGHCYNIPNGGPVCLRACRNDWDCRPGYGCVGTAGQTVCYPRAMTSNECVSATDLANVWWVRLRADATAEQMRLHEDGYVEYERLSPDGLQRQQGQWTSICPRLSVQFLRGGSMSFVAQTGSLFQDGDPTRAWAPCPAERRRAGGKCF